MTNTSSSFLNPSSIPLFTSSFFLVSPKPSASPGKYDQRNPISDASTQTTAQTQDLDMIARLWLGQGQKRGGEEHSLIVRVRYQQAYSLVLQDREPSLGRAHGI